MATPTVRQAKGHKALNAAGVSVTLDSTPLVGNLLVAGLSAPGTQSPVYTPPDAGWTEIGTYLQNGRRVSLWADPVDSGESATVSFTASISDASYGMTVWEVEGANLSSFLDKSIQAPDGGGVDVNLVYPGTGTLVQPDELAILYAGLSGTSGDGHTVTPNTWNIRTAGTNDLAVAADRGLSSTASIQPTAGWTTARRSFGLLITIKGGEPAANPVANAGADQTGKEAFSTVTLTASATGGNPGYTYSWAQLSGDTVTLNGTGASRTFEAPAKLTTQTLVFRVTVTDSLGNTDTDDVNVEVIGHDRFRRTSGAWVGMNDKRRTSDSW